LKKLCCEVTDSLHQKSRDMGRIFLIKVENSRVSKDDKTSNRFPLKAKELTKD